MNPHQKNKIDVSSLSPEEQRLFRLYGKLPSQAAVFAKNQQQRKYFDSGDYALNKAGKGDGMDTGTVGDKHPDLENIRHGSINSPVGSGTAGSGVGGVGVGVSGAVLPTLTKSTSISGPSSSGSIPVGSPAKESSLQRETSAEDADGDENKENGAGDAVEAGEGSAQQGIPIRS